MVSKVEKISGVEHSLSIDVPADKVGEAYKEALVKAGRDATVKGFRKGKAPLATIQAIYGDRVRADVLNDLVSKYYFEALSEHKLYPVCRPEIEITEFDPQKSLSFKAQFEVRPEVKLNHVEGLKLKKEVVRVTEDQINEVLKNVQNQRAQLVDLKEDRSAATGDVVVFDFLGTLDGNPVEGASGNAHTMEIGDNRFLPEFDQALVGMKSSEEKDIKVVFPKDYHHKELAEKMVDFHIKLISVKEKQLPELNDEFIKTLGDETMTLSEFKERIREDIELSESERIKSEVRKQASDLLLELNEVESPRSLVAEQKSVLIERFERESRAQGIGAKDLQEFKEKQEAEFTKEAEETVKLDFLVMAIAEKYGLIPSDEEVEQEQAKVKGMMSMYNSGKDRSSTSWVDSPTYRNYLAHKLTMDKVLDFVIEKAAT